MNAIGTQLCDDVINLGLTRWRRMAVYLRPQIQPDLSVENEQADTGRDGRTRLVGPNSQERAGTWEKIFFLFS